MLSLKELAVFAGNQCSFGFCFFHKVFVAYFVGKVTKSITHYLIDPLSIQTIKQACKYKEDKM
jgi:hypothetical protein